MSEQASRKVMVSPEVMAEWAHMRTVDGRLLRLDWGDPDDDGWYTPVITQEPCDHAFLMEGDICYVCKASL